MTFNNEVPLAYKPLTWELNPYQPYYIVDFFLFIKKPEFFLLYKTTLSTESWWYSLNQRTIRVIYHEIVIQGFQKPHLHLKDVLDFISMCFIICGCHIMCILLVTI